MIYNEKHIGKKVFYSGNSVTGACKGTIIAMHSRNGKQPAWALVEVDELPENWPYVGLNTFAPDLSKLTLLKD